MSDDRYFDDPTNCVVCIFDQHEKALEARAALVALGFPQEHTRIFQGTRAASEIDTSAKWFADTDDILKEFERELRDGGTILAVPVSDSNRRENVHYLLKSYDARNITHFGQWITEVMR